MYIQQQTHGAWSRMQDVEEYVVDALAENYADGQIESLATQQSNAQKMLGRLINTLAEKGLLTGTEICRIVEDFSGYTEDDICLTPKKQGI